MFLRGQLRVSIRLHMNMNTQMHQIIENQIIDYSNGLVVVSALFSGGSKFSSQLPHQAALYRVISIAF